MVDVRGTTAYIKKILWAQLSFFLSAKVDLFSTAEIWSYCSRKGTNGSVPGSMSSEPACIQHKDNKPGSPKRNTAFNVVINYTCAFPTMTRQNACPEEGLLQLNVFPGEQSRSLYTVD